jgi:hypothetical protein
MKKNIAIYSILSTDDPVYSGSHVMLSSAVIRHEVHGLLLILIMNVTKFFNY